MAISIGISFFDRYDYALKLHELWRSYILELLPTQSTSKTAHLDMAEKLLKADFHGAHLTGSVFYSFIYKDAVAQSTCATLMGQSGIVLQETRNMFKIVTARNKMIS